LVIADEWAKTFWDRCKVLKGPEILFVTEKGLLGFAALKSRLAEQILTAANTE
jgi:hypothetical protein